MEHARPPVVEKSGTHRAVKSEGRGGAALAGLGVDEAAAVAVHLVVAPGAKVVTAR